MMNILTPTFTALTVVMSVGAIWMAIWAWRTFRISILMWLVVGRIVGGASALLNISPDHAKLESALKTLQTQSNLSPSDLFTSMAYLTNLFPMLSSLGLLLIALGEFSHFGPSITPSYKPHWVLTFVYRLRHLFGIFAVTCALVPSVALYFWFISLV